MNSTDKTAGPIVVLNYPALDKPLLGYAKGVLAAFLASAYFPNPTLKLVIFAADIDEYDKAETLAGTKALGAVALRNAKRKKVIADLHHLRDYVQSVIEAQVNLADALAMIHSVGFFAKKLRQQFKAALQARNVGPSGHVKLDARSLGANVVYYWQYSVDQSTWINVPETLKASVLVTGLTKGTTYFFRFRALTRAGAVDFSQVVSLLVT